MALAPRRGTILRLPSPPTALHPSPRLHEPMRSPSLLRSAFVALAAVLALSPSDAAAQCTYTLPANTFAGGANDGVAALAALPNGDLVAGGRFTSIGGVACNRIARWNGTNWSPLGLGTNADVYALTVLGNGDLIAGGAFTTADGLTVNGIARWNGTAWSALGSGVDPLVPLGSSVQAIAVLGNGDIVIAGSFQTIGGVTVNNIARWNGAAWSSLGTGINGAVRALTVGSNGDLFATGGFTQAGGLAAASIARWNGSTWSAIGTGLGLFGGNALGTMPNGDIVVGGSFITSGGVTTNRVARWNGSTWSALGTGTGGIVSSLLPLPTGDLVIGGLFTTAGGAPANRIARWNGSAWSAFGTGADAGVNELLLAPNGSVLAGGEFLNANGVAASRLATISSSCAPTVVSTGGGCTGSGGPNVLTATQLPLLGGQFRAVGTGMPALGFVVSVFGFTTTALPLGFVFPEALAGCTLTVSPDIIGTTVPVAGQVTTVLPFGNTPSLLGASFLHQMVPFELDLTLAITQITATNGLQVTIGSF